MTTLLKKHTLRDEKGSWIGTVILDNYGTIYSYTDYGSFNIYFGSYGFNGDFDAFICSLDEQYLAKKAHQFSNGYNEKRAQKWAEMILPLLKEAIKNDPSKID